MHGNGCLMKAARPSCPCLATPCKDRQVGSRPGRWVLTTHLRMWCMHTSSRSWPASAPGTSTARSGTSPLSRRYGCAVAPRDERAQLRLVAARRGAPRDQRRRGRGVARRRDRLQELPVALQERCAQRLVAGGQRGQRALQSRASAWSGHICTLHGSHRQHRHNGSRACWHAVNWWSSGQREGKVCVLCRHTTGKARTCSAAASAGLASVIGSTMLYMADSGRQLVQHQHLLLVGAARHARRALLRACTPARGMPSCAAPRSLAEPGALQASARPAMVGVRNSCAVGTLAAGRLRAP